ncbi:g6976 [Coccomyxa viridis]|uniref:superoxide dismutase n=1 Tax=Coccomyxa viridis TaxID=1274662 RepID=A0ABP1FZ20_9CHLO
MMMKVFVAAALAVATLAASVQGQAPAPSPAGLPKYPLMQPALPYPYSAQEPLIDNTTQMLHWSKHLATYYENVNKAIMPFPALQVLTVEQMMPAAGTSAVPMNISKAVRNNAGGVYNHLLFFKILMPATAATNASNNSMLPQQVGQAINQTFGNYTVFKKNFTEAALSVFGSGWAWLTVAKNGSLAIETTPNQDNPLMVGAGYSGNQPILGIDVWEHAYYLKRQNRRPEYIMAWWYVVNWPQVNMNYMAATSGNKTMITSYASS